MIYKNPVLSGFYPDPSVCRADDRYPGKYFMVCSSFQYFPGVPLFESEDLVNWRQIGNILSRESQLLLDGAQSSAGIFAPTIRYYNGVFYMVTTNTTTNRNFYVYTDDIYGEWSEPVNVEQDGIDPSLYFEDGHAYFMSNGTDDHGDHGVVQCEIDIRTGKKLSDSSTLWHGSGGRFLESPHLYRIGGWYYLMAAEGGTEYGHMITCARSRLLWGEYESCPFNPVLTNRNLGGFEIQGVGHGDLIQKQDTGEWFVIHLGFRQIGQWATYHHIGREVFMSPVKFNDDGWFTVGKNGTTASEFEIQGSFEQKPCRSAGFADKLDWLYIRRNAPECYELSDERFILHGTEQTLDMMYPTFVGIRQTGLCGSCECSVKVSSGEGGITLYMDEQHHHELAVRRTENGFEAILRLNIGDAKYIRSSVPLCSDTAQLHIDFSNYVYTFSVIDAKTGVRSGLGTAQTRYLSTEVAGGFTGVIIGLYSQGSGSSSEFTDFRCEY
ncbi:MAG: family 43 glycosylhydrolase [Ruminococcus sp.]|nr:family 43 glycosylhydrolase [Ruminococcus sp.]